MMNRTIEQAVQKLFVIEGRYLVAGTGEVGLAQRFNAIVAKAHSDNIFCKGSHIDAGKELCLRTRQDFGSTGVQPGVFGGLVAYLFHKEVHLCEFALKDLQPEWKEGKMWFTSMGSGQMITDPFLGLLRKVFFKDTVPNLREGIFVAMWALQHAIELNPGGINGPAQIGTLTVGGAKIWQDEELQEHIENVKGAENHLSLYKEKLAGKSPGEKIPVVDSGGKSEEKRTAEIKKPS
jgi:hypothetical protein